MSGRSVAGPPPWRCRRRRPAASRGCPIRAGRASAPTARRTSSRRASPRRSRSCPGRSTATAAAASVDAALARYRGALRRDADARRRAARRAAGSARDGRPSPLDEVEDARAIARRFVVSAMSVGRPEPRGPPGADDRDPARRRCREHRRGRRGPGLVRARTGRPPARRADQAGRLGPVRRDRDVPRPRRPARDQDLAGLQARRGRPAPRAQGHGLHRRAPARPGRPELHQPAAAPRHLLDRGPRPAHRRPARDQPDGARRGQARRQPGCRHDRRGRGQGRRDVHPPVRPRRRDRRVAARHRSSTSARPWELGLAEVHQVLLRNDLRDRVALRTDGGLQTGRDLLVAALLGAEEFAFGTAALVAVGCDMARQCHLDTCPTGIATQREDLRAKFTGTPEMVERFFLAVAEDLRRELAAVGARSVGEIIGESRRLPAADRGRPGRARAGRRGAVVGRRCRPGAPTRSCRPGRRATLRRRRWRPASPPRSGTRARSRSAGCACRPPIGRSVPASPARSSAASCAGRSASSCAGPRASRSGRSRGRAWSCTLVGQANDYVGKGLSGGRITISPEPDLAAAPAGEAIAGNTVLYGATAGRLHLVGRAGMRFAVRNSGAEAVVEGIGPHGCEYMTGGTVVGARTGRRQLRGRDDRRASVPVRPEWPPRGGAAWRQRCGRPPLGRRSRNAADGPERLVELLRLLEDHASAGSALAARLLALDDLACRLLGRRAGRPGRCRRFDRDRISRRPASRSARPPLAAMSAPRAIPDPGQAVV